jgi:hypothetical protein
MRIAQDRFNDPQARTERFLLAAHRLAMTKLHEAPHRIEELAATIARWRAQGALTRSEPYMREWERLLRLPLDDLERVICAGNDHATVLRSVSPIACLISGEERDRLRRQVRLEPGSGLDSSESTP